MENVLNEKETQNVKVKKEASQKAMASLVVITGLLCLAVACGAVIFTAVLKSL